LGAGAWRQAATDLGRDILALAIAYARQERLNGGLSRPVAKELDRPLARTLGDGATGAPRPPATPLLDRLTRSLADFAKLVELFDQHGVSFVSVTQSFNTTSSMGRLTLNVLLSFAQFEPEVIGERVRDKIAASKRKSMVRSIRLFQ
jgi:site-specific DNA recombinase